MRAVTPATGLAASASCNATASGLAGGLGPEPPSAPAARAVPAPRTAQTSAARRRRREVGRRRSMGMRGQALRGRSGTVRPCSEGSLTIDPAVPASGRSSVKRRARDRHVPAVALARWRARWPARARSPGGPRSRPAPEALEGRCGLRRARGPAPSSATARRARSPAAATVTVTAAGRPVRSARWRRGCRRRARAPRRSPDDERPGPAAATSTRAVGRRGGRARDAVERDDVAGAAPRRPRARARAGRRQARQALGVGLEVGERLGVGAVAGDVRDVPAQRGERRAQLVRGVGQEAPLAPRARARARRACALSVRGELAHLVAGRRRQAAAGGVAGALDVARGGRQAPQRAQRRGASAAAPPARADERRASSAHGG